jgi:hypothetical protein
VFHVELRQFPRVAYAFNLSEEELRTKFVVPWVRGQVIEYGDLQFSPERAKLTIYEGRRLETADIGQGRGWANARRGGEDVTDRMFGAATSPTGGNRAALEEFKQVVLAQCASGRIGVHQVMWLANARYPEQRVSERMALAEQSVWELLHQGRLTMYRDSSDPVGNGDWQGILLAWETWSSGRGPTAFLEAV